jgi:hypothetical protein
VNEKQLGIRRIGQPGDGVVLLALRTCEHLPYVGKLITTLVKQNYKVHIVGVSSKPREIALFSEWIDGASLANYENVTLFAYKEKRIQRRIQETLEYILNLRQSDPMTKSERSRTNPSYVLHMHEQGQKLKASLTLLLLKALSKLSIRLFEFFLIKNEGRSREYVINEIKKSNPQYLIASPGNMKGCKERVWLRECNLRGIPTAIVVLSWDNPTTKGAFLEKPDVVFVQSNFQHGVVMNQGFEPNQIQVVGSVHIERLLDVPLQMPEERGNRIQIIYLGSSIRTAINQEIYLDNVINLLESYSSYDYELYVRPHPKNPIQGNVLERIQNNKKIILTESSLQITQEDNESYSHLLLSADCVLGEATSALVEAKILGANVFVLDFLELSRSDERHLNELQNSGFIETINDRLQLREVIESTLNRENPNRISCDKKWNSRVICDSHETSNRIVNYMVLLSQQSRERNNTDVV